tara:strand:- start:138 stop:506 length:369 start_codon:yes stop_codon:yes gene_type:complete
MNHIKKYHNMGRIFITFGLVFFAISVFGIYLDIWLHINGSKGYTQIGQIWYKYSPNSLQVAEAVVSRYIDPCSSLDILNCSGFVWHPIISTFLILPAGLTFGTLTICFIYFGTKKRRINKDN